MATVSVGKHKVEKMEHKDMSGKRASQGKKKDDCGNMKIHGEQGRIK